MECKQDSWLCYIDYHSTLPRDVFKHRRTKNREIAVRTTIHPVFFARQSWRDINVAIPPLCPPVCLSVTLWYSVETFLRITKLFSPPCR